MWAFILRTNPQNAHSALEHKKQQQETNDQRSPNNIKNNLNTHAKTCVFYQSCLMYFFLVKKKKFYRLILSLCNLNYDYHK